MNSPTSILDTNLEGIGGSLTPVVTDVSVMVIEESGITSFPSTLICCSEPAGSRGQRTGGGE